MDFQFEKMCRICLKEEEDLKSIFYSDEMQCNHISLPNKIMACSSVQVVPGDGLPELICNKCLVQVDVAYEFKEKCQSADATLRKYLTVVGHYPSSDTLTLTENLMEEPKTESIMLEDDFHVNVYEFDKDDTVNHMDDNKRTHEFNESDSDAPLIERQNAANKKKKRERTSDGKSYKKGKSKKTSEDENGSDSDRRKKGKDEKDVKCPICKKTFAYLCILKDHMVQHTGAKPYLCSVCGKSFGHTASLTNHMKTHYSDKPHKCDRCELSFHRRAHLVLHMRTHTGEKPFVCDVCGRDFAQSSYLKEHMRVHSGEKPFVCDICGHGFARKSCLVMHRRVHTGELPYACPECGRAFSQRSQRKRHVKRNHKGSACLRATGELILKDLDLKNKNSGQDEMTSDISLSLQRDDGMMQRDTVAMTLQRQSVAPSMNNTHFRDLNIFQPDPTTTLNTATMPLPLIQIHRTLLQ